MTLYCDLALLLSVGGNGEIGCKVAKIEIL